MKDTAEQSFVEMSSVFRAQGQVMTAAMPSVLERCVKLFEGISGAPAQETEIKR